MNNFKFIILTSVMLIFAVLFIAAYPIYGTGAVIVYGNEYVTKYFQRDQVMQINIELDETDWHNMIKNAIEEEFYPAKVTVNGDVYPLVQVRTKGNSSLSSVARSDSDRYSFKINFGFKRKIANQTMAGLTQLNLNNCFSDPSYMREYLSYQIFEEMGVAVPAFSYAALHINGEYFGLYLAVESILEPYLERNFGDLTGDLYKSLGNTLKYNGASKLNYTGLEVRTKSKNTVKNNDWSKLIKMLDVLNNGGDDLEKYLDVDATLRYIAVSTALANFDSYQGGFAHNYYLYEQNGKFTILPWDLNMSFGGFSFGGDATRVYIDEPTQGALDSRPLIAKLLANENYLAAYHAYLEQIATKFLGSGYLEAETGRLSKLISDYVRTDPTAFYTHEQFQQNISGTITGGAMGDENQAEAKPEAQEQQGRDNESGRQGFRMGGMRGFGSNIPGILEFAAAMSESIQKQLSGELPSSNNGNGMEGGLGGGGAPNIGGGRRYGQQHPDGHDDRPPLGERQPVKPGEEVAPPEGWEGRGWPPGPGEGMRPGNFPPNEGVENNHRFPGRGAQQSLLQNKTAFIVLLVSGAAIVAGIIVALLFKRREYIKI